MKKLATILTFITIASISLTFSTALADEPKGFQLPSDLKPEYAVSYTVAGQNDSQTANTIMQILAGGLIYLAAPIAVLLIAIGGLRYVISRGDQNAMEEAKKNITWAIIGLIIIALSWAIIVNVIQLISALGT